MGRSRGQGTAVRMTRSCPVTASSTAPPRSAYRYFYRSWANKIYPHIDNTQIFLCPGTTSSCSGVADGLPA